MSEFENVLLDLFIENGNKSGSFFFSRWNSDK